MKIYLVGGIIRDRLLGMESNDYDYSVVLEPSDGTFNTIKEGFEFMSNHFSKLGYQIFQTREDMQTIRAKFPKGHIHEGLTADFVLARKEIGYKEGTREPILELGTLYDDLVRRDFTINALAEDIDDPNNIIDLFGGIEDLKNQILITPTHPTQTLLDDPLRLLRAFRFAITKECKISDELFFSLLDGNGKLVLNKLKQVVSQERIQNELNKMFKYNTGKSILLLNNWNNDLGGKLFPIIFKQGYYLQMTNKK